jgi:hypothetical protein
MAFEVLAVPGTYLTRECTTSCLCFSLSMFWLLEKMLWNLYLSFEACWWFVLKYSYCRFRWNATVYRIETKFVHCNRELSIMCNNETWRHFHMINGSLLQRTNLSPTGIPEAFIRTSTRLYKMTFSCVFSVYHFLFCLILLISSLLRVCTPFLYFPIDISIPLLELSVHQPLELKIIIITCLKNLGGNNDSKHPWGFQVINYENQITVCFAGCCGFKSQPDQHSGS